MLQRLALIGNVVWFGLAFWCFAVRSEQYACLVVPKSKVDANVYAAISWTIKFLGGLNLAIALLAATMLGYPHIFHERLQNAVLMLFFGIAHGTQFVYNIPIALRELQRKPHLWPVLTGEMLTIFIGDGILCGFNVFVATLFI
jgi:hypothetical protein